MGKEGTSFLWRGIGHAHSESMQFLVTVEMCRILAAGDDAVAVAGLLKVDLGVEFSNNVHLFLEGKCWSIRSSVLAMTI